MRIASRRTSSAAPSGSTTPAAATSNSSRAAFRSGLRLDGLKVVIDCAHGAAYKVAPTVLWELGRRGRCRSASRPTASTSTATAARWRRRRCSAQCVAHTRRSRHRARRRRRPAAHRRRGAARILDGDQLMALIALNWQRSRPARRRRRRGDRDVESRPRAPSRSAAAFRCTAPWSATATWWKRCAARLQSRRRAIRPHHPRRLLAPPATG